MLESLREAKRKVIGTKQTLRALETEEVGVCFLAEDADPKVTQPVKRLCERRKITLIRVPTMNELGVACGIDVGAAAAAILVEEHTA